ncbi:hypothetical protein CC86DRAFT_440079 [Ophiobolus disseminans]|uniref:Uncharacterized protein n=1 Tax=Ophiobolus disseminans TaxID=1469910 RepID=A0A6A7A3A1_9PLEO|nr:hypothetical protein CC86DRAFT_440079 [Ophiobolus disseminans]
MLMDTTIRSAESSSRCDGQGGNIEFWCNEQEATNMTSAHLDLLALTPRDPAKDSSLVVGLSRDNHVCMFIRDSGPVSIKNPGASADGRIREALHIEVPLRQLGDALYSPLMHTDDQVHGATVDGLLRGSNNDMQRGPSSTNISSVMCSRCCLSVSVMCAGGLARRTPSKETAHQGAFAGSRQPERSQVGFGCSLNKPSSPGFTPPPASYPRPSVASPNPVTYPDSYSGKYARQP